MKRWIKFTRSVHDKFPAAVAHLNGAATADEIARLELRFGQALPIVLHELFGTNNGETRDSPGVVFGIRFLSIDDILGVLDSWQEIIF